MDLPDTIVMYDSSIHFYTYASIATARVLTL